MFLVVQWCTKTRKSDTPSDFQLNNFHNYTSLVLSTSPRKNFLKHWQAAPRRHARAAVARRIGQRHPRSIEIFVRNQTQKGSSTVVTEPVSSSISFPCAGSVPRIPFTKKNSSSKKNMFPVSTQLFWNPPNGGQFLHDFVIIQVAQAFATASRPGTSRGIDDRSQGVCYLEYLVTFANRWKIDHWNHYINSCY